MDKSRYFSFLMIYGCFYQKLIKCRKQIQREIFSKSSFLGSKNILSHFESIAKYKISKLFLYICIFTISGHFCWKWLSPKQFFQRKIFEVEFEKFSRKLNTLKNLKDNFFKLNNSKKLKLKKNQIFGKIKSFEKVI